MSKNWSRVLLIICITVLLFTSSSCKLQRGKDPVDDKIDEMISASKDKSSSENEDQNKSSEEDTTKSEDTSKDEEPEQESGVFRLFDEHDNLLLEVEWMMRALHPAVTKDDQVKVAFFEDAKGDKKYSDLSKTAGVDVPQNEMVGWGYMMLTNFLPAGPPPDEIFPCDTEVQPDAEWHTVCMNEQQNSLWGDFYVIFAVHDEPIEWQDQMYYHSHSVAFDSDGLPENNFFYNEPYNGDYFRDTDRQYEAWYDLDQGRWMGNSLGPQFSLVPSDARFVFKGNTVFTLIQTSDFSVHDPAGRITTFLTTGGYNPEDCGYDTNGEDSRDNLHHFTADPIYIMDEGASLAGIILDDDYEVAGSGCTLAQRPEDGGQKTMLWCLDSGCAGNGGSCKLFNRLKGDSPQEPDSWNYVADGDQKMQKDNEYEYHCFCVK